MAIEMTQARHVGPFVCVCMCKFSFFFFVFRVVHTVTLE